MVGMNIGLSELMGWRLKAVAKWQKNAKYPDWKQHFFDYRLCLFKATAKFIYIVSFLLPSVLTPNKF